jgi:hypothetical protein
VIDYYYNKFPETEAYKEYMLKDKENKVVAN